MPTLCTGPPGWVLSKRPGQWGLLVSPARAQGEWIELREGKPTKAQRDGSD